MATMHKIYYGHYHIIPYVNYSCTVIGKGLPGPNFCDSTSGYMCIKCNILTCVCSETIENLKSQNAVALMKLTGETDKRREVESQLNCAEDEKEKLKLERVRLQIKMDELRMKLQQGN